jgi:hypothetical protein
MTYLLKTIWLSLLYTQVEWILFCGREEGRISWALNLSFNGTEHLDENGGIFIENTNVQLFKPDPNSLNLN